jgi:hypothetical protein
MTIGESINIFASQEIKVPAFGTVKTEQFKKRITWDTSKFKLISAKLITRANQPYRSGAELDVMVNGEQGTMIDWHANEVEERADEADISASIVNGDNSFELVYRTAFGTLTEQIAVTSASIALQFEGNRTGSGSPVDTGGTQDKNQFNKIVSGLRDNAIGITVGIAVVGVSILFIKSAVGGFSIRDFVR